MVPISHWIVPISHIMVLISHLMVPIEWVPYPQKECGYCRMTHPDTHERLQSYFGLLLAL